MNAKFLNFYLKQSVDLYVIISLDVLELLNLPKLSHGLILNIAEFRIFSGLLRVNHFPIIRNDSSNLKLQVRYCQLPGLVMNMI